MKHGLKKPVIVASDEFRRMFQQLSKAALIDTLWCACQLGTNETDTEIVTQAARNAGHALDYRGDRMPADLREARLRHIDSDGSAEIAS